MFYLCIPFLNILITHLDKKQHLCLVSLSLGIYTVLGTLPGIEVRMNYVSWFCTLYFVASYIRFYEEKYKGHVKWGVFDGFNFIVCSKRNWSFVCK